MVMSAERAEEIRVAVYGRAMHRMGFREDWCRERLPDCSLAEMLEAMVVIRGEKEEQKKQGGSFEMKMTVDDRLIAALYALEHYGSPEDLIEALGFTLEPDEEDDD